MQSWLRLHTQGHIVHDLVGGQIAVDRFHDWKTLRRLRVRHWVAGIEPGHIIRFCPCREIVPVGSGVLFNLGHYLVLTQTVQRGCSGVYLAEVGAFVPDVTILGVTHRVAQLGHLMPVGQAYGAGTALSSCMR